MARVEAGDVPVFWACGLRPQLALPGSGAEYVITDYPGHMFVFVQSVESGPAGVLDPLDGSS